MLLVTMLAACSCRRSMGTSQQARCNPWEQGCGLLPTAGARKHGTAACLRHAVTPAPGVPAESIKAAWAPLPAGSAASVDAKKRPFDPCLTGSFPPHAAEPDAWEALEAGLAAGDAAEGGAQEAQQPEDPLAWVPDLGDEAVGRGMGPPRPGAPPGARSRLPLEDFDSPHVELADPQVRGPRHAVCSGMGTPGAWRSERSSNAYGGPMLPAQARIAAALAAGQAGAPALSRFYDPQGAFTWAPCRAEAYDRSAAARCHAAWGVCAMSTGGSRPRVGGAPCAACSLGAQRLPPAQAPSLPSTPLPTVPKSVTWCAGTAMGAPSGWDASTCASLTRTARRSARACARRAGGASR